MHVAGLAKKLEGLSIKTSKESVITATFDPNAALKHSGMVFLKASQSGQNMKPIHSFLLISWQEKH